MITGETTIFYILILLVVSLALFGVVLTILYIRLVAKIISIKEDQKLDPRFNLIDQAEKVSKEIIQKANIKAAELISSAEAFNKNHDEYFQKKLEVATQIYAGKYQEVLKTAQEEASKTLSNISKDIRVDIVSEIDKFRGGIQEELLNFQKTITQAVKETYQKAELEVQNYRDVRMKQVDESILEVVEEVSRKVLAKEISDDEHEKMVLRALEEAKSQNLLLTQEDHTKDKT